MDTVKKILSAPIVSIPLGIAVFTVVIGGSLGDFYQFAHGLLTGESCSVWIGAFALTALVLVSGLYFFLNSSHNHLRSKATTPDLEGVNQDHAMKVESLNRFEDTSVLWDLASEAFKKDAMPLDLIQKLHWYSRKTVYLLRHSKDGIVGYLALFVPKPELKVAIFEGTTDPLDWNISDLADGDAFLGAGYVYLESTVIKSPYEKLGLCILLRHALSEIESALTESGIPDRNIEFFGLAGSPEGKNLMQNTLGLHSIMFAHNRKDKMELFNGFKSTTDFTALKNKVKAITNCLILRKARFSV